MSGPLACEGRCVRSTTYQRETKATCKFPSGTRRACSESEAWHRTLCEQLCEFHGDTSWGSTPDKLGGRTYRTSSSQPYFIKSSSVSRVRRCDMREEARLGSLTLKLVFADVDEAGGLNDVGGEVVHHGCGCWPDWEFDRCRCERYAQRVRARADTSAAARV